MTSARTTTAASVVVAATFSVARADVINVPGNYLTIQAAINAAQDGDEIVVAPGTYNGFLTT